MASRRKFTKEFKIGAVARLNSGQTIAEVARALEVHPTMVLRWREQLEDRGEEAAFPAGQREAAGAESDRRVGAQGRPAADGDRFFERALRRIDEQRRLQARTTRAFYQQIEGEVKTAGTPHPADVCEVAGFSRGGYYRFRSRRGRRGRWICGTQSRRLRWSGPATAAAGLPHELKERGWKVNRKRVQRLMREDNLLCVAKRKFIVTTDSAHSRKVYPNLARVDDRDRVESALGGGHHLYPSGGGVHLPGGRVGRVFTEGDRLALDRTLEASLALTALQMALTRRSRAGTGAPFRSRHSVRLRGVYRALKAGASRSA